MKSTIRFSVKIESRRLLTLPKYVSAKLPSQGKTMIEGTINGLPFRTSLEPTGSGSHSLKVSKDTKETAIVEITRLGDELETRAPIDLQKALAATPRALALWTDITPIARRDWIFWIISGKLAETRKRRIEKACDKLSSGERRVCCFGGITWLMKNG